MYYTGGGTLSLITHLRVCFTPSTIIRIRLLWQHFNDYDWRKWFLLTAINCLNLVRADCDAQNTWLDDYTYADFRLFQQINVSTIEEVYNHKRNHPWHYLNISCVITETQAVNGTHILMELNWFVIFNWTLLIRIRGKRNWIPLNFFTEKSI